jgi:hypothetical protein
VFEVKRIKTKTWKAVAMGMAAGIVMMYAGSVALTKSFTLRSLSVCSVVATNPVTVAAIATPAGSSKEKVKEVKPEPVRKLPVMVSLIEYAGKRFVEDRNGQRYYEGQDFEGKIIRRVTLNRVWFRDGSFMDCETLTANQRALAMLSSGG